MSRFFVNTLKLHQFRNFPSFEVTLCPKTVVLKGANGSGKTSILEALSLLAPGKGLRASKLTEMNRDFIHPWAVHARFEDKNDVLEIGTALDMTSIKEKRRIKINHQDYSTQNSLNDFLNVIWLTPQQDGLFINSTTQRRHYFDRLVAALIPSHLKSLNVYEHSLKERLKLLKSPPFDAVWVQALEESIAQNGCDILTNRFSFLEKLSAYAQDLDSFLPKVTFSCKGELETFFLRSDKQTLKEYFKKNLQENRLKDGLTGMTTCGVHRSDFLAFHQEVQRHAHYCSTGQQKMILITLLMAFLKTLLDHQSKTQPKGTLLLLDDVVAHLDFHHRMVLLEELCCNPLITSCVHTWISGTDAELSSLGAQDTQVVELEAGTLKEIY